MVGDRERLRLAWFFGIAESAAAAGSMESSCVGIFFVVRDEIS